MKDRSQSQVVRIALVVVALVAVAAAGYLLVIGPKRAAAADAQLEIDQTQAQIAVLRAQARAPKTPVEASIDASEVFRLTKAMPDRADMAEVILELNRIATDTGIVFESITPALPTAGAGYQVLPIALSFQGNFYNLSDFLFRLRNLVAVRDGRLSAAGRLFNVQSVTFGASTKPFPQLEATVTVNAYVFGSGDSATTLPAAAAPTGDAAPPEAPPATTTATAIPAAGGTD